MLRGRPPPEEPAATAPIVPTIYVSDGVTDDLPDDEHRRRMAARTLQGFCAENQSLAELKTYAIENRHPTASKRLAVYDNELVVAKRDTTQDDRRVAGEFEVSKFSQS